MDATEGRQREFHLWLERLRQFRSLYGHSDVPPRWEGDPRLARWVFKIRAKPDALLLDELCLLDGAAFDFKADRRWMSHFFELLAFRRDHGHINVPIHWPRNRSLGIWLSRQRLERKTLPLVRRRLLDKAGIDWHPLETKWEQNFERLEAYQASHGHCRVTERENPKLSLWIANIRARRKITSSQKKRLDRLGFDWNVEESIWLQRIGELEAFAKRFGHTNVPARWPENEALAACVAELRSGHRHVPQELRSRFDAIGFDWRPVRDQLWEKRFAELTAFLQAHGHCKVPIQFPENPELGKWVGTQRMNRREMTPDRIVRLDKLGFTWKVIEMSDRREWDDRFAELVAFREKFGHVAVPSHWPKNQPLAFWAIRQRSRDKPKLTPDQIRRLNEIGFAWDARDRRWRQRLVDLIAFKQRFGHTEVPGHWPENKVLARWIFKVRELKRSGKLSPERIGELSALGFRWGYLPEPEKQQRAQAAKRSTNNPGVPS